MSWHDDDLFKAVHPDSLDELGGIASPAFRLTAQGSLNDAHPLDHVDAYDRLFQVFRPVLERFAERLAFTEVAGAKARRRISITKDDWQPFHHLRSVVPDDDRHWVGFDFKSGKTEKVFDKGPTGFRLRVARTVQVVATVPVSALESGEIDIQRLKDAMLGLPVRSAIAGYGMATSAFFDGHEYARAHMLPVARKYPVLDVCPSPLRAWFSDRDNDVNDNWVTGVNWITLVGEPYLSVLGGADAITNSLPDGIEARVAGNAVLFQIGECPITGQVGVDDGMLPLYRALGDRLKPQGNGCPSQEHPRQPVFGEEYSDSSLLWDRRFFDGRWFEETGK